jgi:hypothetical protein
VLTLHPLSSASLIAIEYGSHDTGKFIVIVSETMPHLGGGGTMNPGAWTPHATSGTSALWYSFRDRQSEVQLDRTMRTGREIRSYDYVNRPYGRVRDELRQNALTVFQSATKAAASRAQSIAAELHVDFGGIGVKTDINISVRNIEEKVVDTTSTPPRDCCWSGRPRPCRDCFRS